MIEVLLIGGAVFVFLCLLLIGWGIGQYNFFVARAQDIKTQWSNIKTEYQRRFDMFMNLVETVKSYKKHEKGTLKEVIQARNALSFKGDKKQQLKSMGMLDNLFSKLAVLVEQYPNLKANEQHNTLMEEVRISEDRINVARTSYNTVIRNFNVAVKTFPSSIVANMFRFAEEEFYINEERTNAAPKINLD